MRCRRPAASSQPAPSGSGEQHAVGRRRRRGRRGPADHRGPHGPPVRAGLVAHRPARRGTVPLRPDGQRARHGGRRRARRRGQHVVRHRHRHRAARVGVGRRPSAARRAPAGPRPGWPPGPAGPGRCATAYIAPEPAPTTTACARQSGRGTTAAYPATAQSPSSPSSTPASVARRCAADLLVQRHRVAAHQRRLQPAQAEPVGVGLVPGGRRRAFPDGNRAARPGGAVRQNVLVGDGDRVQALPAGTGRVTTGSRSVRRATGGGSGATSASWSSS